jgi:hypothetical protein
MISIDDYHIQAIILVHITQCHRHRVICWKAQLGLKTTITQEDQNSIFSERQQIEFAVIIISPAISDDM